VTAAARIAVVGLALAAGAAGAAAARADDGVVARRMAFAERGRELVVSTSFAELFDAPATAALSSGFPTTVVVRVYVYRSSDELPVSLAIVRLEVVYDLWDDVYVLRVTTPTGTADTRQPSRARVLEALTRIVDLPIAPLARVPIGPHHFAALVAELNPVSEELQAETRRWVTQRAGERLDAGSSFFGSFVSVFVNPRIGAADRVVRLRSQPFYRVPR
jgi:hypothetical protein